MHFSQRIKDKILGTSLKRKTKILIINIAIGLFLLTSTAFIALIGLKYDYDSSFINQEQKLKQLIVIQNIYSDILAEFVAHKASSDKISLLKQAWQDFKAIQENSNYGTQFKEFYAQLFTDYNQQLYELSESEDQITQIIEYKIPHNTQIDFKEFTSVAFNLNALLHHAIELRIEIINLKKSATNSLFRTSLFFIAILVAIIVLTTLIFSQIIISSIGDLYSSLEDIILQKTKELRNINEHLQERIDEEVKASRQKDQIMYQQARLASIGEMIQNIAHQWRQPLNSLVLLIQSFKSKFDHNKLTQEFIKNQTQNALRIAHNMSETIENFRNFFHPNTEKTNFSIQKSIQDSIDILAPNLESKNITTHIQSPEEIFAFGYENAFTQVILNLINNTSDAISSSQIKQGIIQINIARQGNTATIIFQDNAGGIKVGEIDKIFEPYFTTKHKSVGTGVGLYMVKQIIEEQMGGKIIAQNTRWIDEVTYQEYYGAQFKITLPNQSHSFYTQGEKNVL